MPSAWGWPNCTQLRGRVGRGSKQSLAILLYYQPLSEAARARLKVIYENNDGFEIARQDLRLRGPGEYLGARQSGAPLLRFADLERDTDLMEPRATWPTSCSQSKSPVGERTSTAGSARASSSSRHDGDPRAHRRLRELMRLDKPIGILLLLWPTLWALWLARAACRTRWCCGSSWSARVLMRSAGCASTTSPTATSTRRSSARASGRSPRARSAVGGARGRRRARAVRFAIVLRFNTLTIKLSFVALAITVDLSLHSSASSGCRRRGSASRSASAFRWRSRRSRQRAAARWALLAANVFWTIAYDTEYAMVDRDDDVRSASHLRDPLRRTTSPP
jgi:hypothetical protein